jgi:excisionase family DNA binding protein
MEENTEYLSAKETAKKIRTSEAQVFEWVRNGTLKNPVVARIGRKILINARELDTWLQKGGSMQKG